ncbi:MAG: VCBS repeat-containing protein [Verrucomicrobia bacterium]|nr:MAG: VCBS repeat-containing protein [Verrucomicrobiota bacterium]
MMKGPSPRKRPAKRTRFAGPLTFLLAAAAGGLAIALWTVGGPANLPTPGSAMPDQRESSKITFDKVSLTEGKSAVRTANVQIVDLDRDGLNDILVCDAARNAVILYRQIPGGQFEERVLGDNLKCPAHATVVDLDKDGDLDVVVAVLGSIFPWDELVGRVVLLENEGDRFTQHVLLDDVRRVADVQAGDLDGDGDIDLAVAVFGYARGEVLWLENLGKKDGRWHFLDHQLLDHPGAIHVPIGDLDGDGDLDIAAIVSQDEEELWVFENLGRGQFKPRRIYASPNYDVGSAGLVMCDLDKDGKADLLLPQGDNLEDPYAWPQPYHGCLWFRNLGNWKFESKRIATFGGTYAAAVGDIDGDGDLDVVLVSLCNDWSDPTRPSVVWLENDGHQNFKMWPIDRTPIGLITVACGDLNNDGRADIVAGSLILPPVTERRVQRITTWVSRKGK